MMKWIFPKFFMPEKNDPLLPLPQYFYKYRNFNENALSNLINDTVYFSHPQKLNDLFELAIDKSDPDKTIKFYTENYPKFPVYIFEKTKINVLQENLSDKEKEKIMLQLENDEQNKGFVFSLSENSDIRSDNKDENLLMWSHYAAGGRGFCIEYSINTKEYISKKKRDGFDESDESDEFDCYERESLASSLPPSSDINEIIAIMQKPASNTTYAKEKEIEQRKLRNVIYSPHCPNALDYERIPFFKFSQWEYEKEWRLFLSKIADTEKGRGVCCKKLGIKISGIIFGHGMPQDQKETIRKIFENKVGKPDNKVEKPDFFQAKRHDAKGYFKIEKCD